MWSADATAARTRKDDARAAVAAPAPKLEVAELKGKLFPKELPLDQGPLPAGLANPSAQGCAACHPVAAAQWAASGHARPPGPALREAAVGLPACLACHLPLTEQQPELFTYDAGRADRPVGRPNPAFAATLRIEGVTCGACHVRDGAIAVATDVAAAKQAPHPLVYAEALATSEACAACHQLSWPGAPEPLYDTFGEWKRSGFAAIGVTCQGCHMLGAAEGGIGADHRFDVDPARAVSVLLDAPTLTWTRGAAPVRVTVTLQNTGAGHAFPTGTPFRGMRLRASLVPPDGSGAAPIDVLAVDLARRIDPAPPFAPIEDTRLQAGEYRRYDLDLSLPDTAVAGQWRLRVTVGRTLILPAGSLVPPGGDAGEIVVDKAWELEVR